MRASNAAGCAGMTPAQTIECLDAQMQRPFAVGAGVTTAVANIPTDSAEYDGLIRRVFLANGFTIKEGQDDLKPYVYAAARALVNALTGAEASK